MPETKEVDNKIDEIDELFREHEKIIDKIERAYSRATKTTSKPLNDISVQSTPRISDRDTVLLQLAELIDELGGTKEKILEVYNKIQDRDKRIYIDKKILLKHKPKRDQNIILGQKYGLTKQGINKIIRKIEKKQKNCD